MSDDDEVEFQISMRDDGQAWIVVVSAMKPISHAEMAACLESLAQDLITGEINVDQIQQLGIN